MRSREERRIPRTEPARPPGQKFALGIFALMAVAAPLLFGAVDRLPQIGLIGLLILGILAQPPAVVPLSRWGNRLAVAFLALLLFKEFAPAAWFGHTLWRDALTREFALPMPFTHHPEPGRAVEGLLAGVVGVIWFLWVRRLAADRDSRPLLAWILFVSVAIVAVVSFATRHPHSDAIYGLRYTPDWIGFGPFPNRNHSGNFFAMGAVFGCGCLTWAVLRKQWMLFVIGVLMVGLDLIALLATESRGGLLAFAAGLGVYLALCLLKFRNRRALAAAAGAVLICGAIILIFGSQVFARFQAQEGGDISAATRLGVWKDSIGMWKDAPLLGHGLGSFASIFPLYQKFELENVVAIHPESSWLQWLVELGVLPVLLAVVAAALFVGGHLRESFSRHRSFFLRAGGFAVVAVLLVHALIDVPAHRWGTAGFALAALAIACPMRISGRRVQEPRQAALVPLAVALVWMLPFLWDVPRWSPTELVRLIARQGVPPGVPTAEIEASLHWFPLNADLHQTIGLRLLNLHGRTETAEWQRRFALAARFLPGSWYLSSAQARAVQRHAGIMMALPYWQQAVSRGGLHRDDVLGDALRETVVSPAALSAWGHYVEANPPLLLAYAQLVPQTQAAYYYGRWWKARAAATDLSPGEIRDYYRLAARLGRREQFDEWMTRHPDWEERDYRAWAALFHAWGEDNRSWRLLAAHLPEPEFPVKTLTIPRPTLETTWRTTPKNFVNAQLLAKARLAAGDVEGSEEIIIAVANGGDAPPWFIEKAAHILARRGRIADAVALLAILK